MPLSKETKALIEQQALNDCVCGPGPCSHKTSYIHGATPYAEKWEAAEQENKRLLDCLEYFELTLSLESRNELNIVDLLYRCSDALKPKQ